jgi:hypothetical protein
VPDFQGGLVALEARGGQYLDTIVKFDGITGQPAVHSAPNADSALIQLVPHPDGTIFATTSGGGVPDTVIGIDPQHGHPEIQRAPNGTVA